MKKSATSLAVLALGCGLTLGPVATTADAAQGKVTRVKTTVNLSKKYTSPEGPSLEITIHGYVKGSGCKKNRKIIVKQTDQKLLVGKTRTTKTGTWTLTFSGGEFDPGTYKAAAPEVRIGKLLCKAGTDSTYIGPDES